MALTHNVLNRVLFSLGNGTDNTLSTSAQKSLLRAFPVATSGGPASQSGRASLWPRT
ncbi:MAG: hypothetical protein IPM17_06750 [Verrucomicrobia bacterium]|nr:hypothetical protein [Verrucomicrobiota bacterium]